MAGQLITDHEGLVALYCCGFVGTRATSYKSVLEVDATTLTRGTSPLLDVADIYPVAVKAPLMFKYLNI